MRKAQPTKQDQLKICSVACCGYLIQQKAGLPILVISLVALYTLVKLINTQRDCACIFNIFSVLDHLTQARLTSIGGHGNQFTKYQACRNVVSMTRTRRSRRKGITRQKIPKYAGKP